MFFFGDKFIKILKNALLQKNFELGKKLSDDEYIVTNGIIDFRIDIKDAKAEYSYAKTTLRLDELMRQLELDYTVKYRLVSFHNAQQFLRLMLIPTDKVSEDLISIDFIDGVSKVVGFTTDNHNVTPLDANFIDKWGVPKDVLFAVADKNMCSIFEKTELKVSEIEGNIRVLEFFNEYENMRAALMLCSTFKKLVSDKLGNKFLLVAPSNTSLMAVENVTNNILEAFGPVVIDEYLKASDPIFTDVLLFTQNDITVAGRFKADFARLKKGVEQIEKEKVNS